MSVWYAKAVVLIASILLVGIPATVHRRDKKSETVKSRKGKLERVLLTIVSLALLLYGLGQAAVLPNWVVGPGYLVALALLFAARMGSEERMMREEFGTDYEAFVMRTRRLIPGVW